MAKYDQSVQNVAKNRAYTLNQGIWKAFRQK